MIRNYQINPTIRKHQVFQPCHQKNPVNCSHQEGQMSTLQSGQTDINPAKSQK
jgi:hypothetical protein